MTAGKAELERLTFLILGNTNVESVYAGQDNGNWFVTFTTYRTNRRYIIKAKPAAEETYRIRSIEYQLRELRKALDVVESYRLF